MLTLPAGDVTLDLYNQAIAAMKRRPINDPLSWRYQAAVHAFDDRFGQPGHDPAVDPLPSAGEQSTFWDQCQHASWFFLPWHRMYVHHFEKIVARHVRDLGGPANWALPYWNYSPSDATRLLPFPFRAGTLLADLFITERNANANAGLAFLSATDTDLRPCLERPVFSGAAGAGATGFGGGVTPFNHFGGLESGQCELQPHNVIHRRIGLFMGDPNTAALDPIFWLHHANIDRLWEVWRRRDRTHTNPTSNAWRRQRFQFRDSRGRQVTMTPQQVVNTTAAPLRYVYDDVSDPLASP